MLYELIGVIRPGNLVEIKEIVRTVGALVLSHRGVIRSLHNWGTFLLAKPVTKHRTKHAVGHHFVMRFDSSPATQEAVRSTLGLDPRMLRFGIVRLGDRHGTLQAMAGIEGAKWRRDEGLQM